MRKLKITELNRLTPEAFKDSKKIPCCARSCKKLKQCRIRVSYV